MVNEPTERRRATVICVTPARNAAWTIERLVRCAQRWADHVVIADQGSHDGTRALAERFDRVTVVNNPTQGYDEGEYRRVLLEAARRIPGPRLIVSVDTDEALSANVLESPAWERALHAQPGTILRIPWANVLPGWERAWIPAEPLPVGFVDDGREHSTGLVHVPRVTVREDDPVITFEDVKLLHFQHVDWRSMKAKQRRYQCIEALKHPRKRPVQLYRQYHRMDAFPTEEIHAVDPRWLTGYEALGIDVRSPLAPFPSWMDLEILDAILEHGAARFRRLDIWDVDWTDVARRAGREVAPADVSDPRSRFERAMHRWMAATQQRDPGARATRLIQRVLIPLGW